MQDYLVSKDSKGKLRIVDISYEWDKDTHGFLIRRYTGQYNGKMVLQPVIVVDTGKAKRTVTDQVKLEYTSRINKYLDKGYRRLSLPLDQYSEEDLLNIIPDETTDSNGILKPMKAKEYQKVSASIFEKDYWWASRKLDGVRCMMFVRDGEVHTASRGGKDYDNSTYHITTHPKFKEYMLANPDIILDGELYIHGYSLQSLSGLARLKKETDKCDKLQYFIYDVIDPDQTFEQRLETLTHLKNSLQLDFNAENSFSNGGLQIQILPHEKVEGWSSIKRLHDKYVAEGFEGVVIRRPDKKYGVNKRTNDMIKVKEYQDAEFEIVDYSEGLRPEDMVFVCMMKDGKMFEAKPIGPRELKHEYIDRIDEIIGKMATVKYFNYSDEGIPTQTVLKCIRDYE